MSEFGDGGSGIGDRDRFDVAIDLAVREMLDVEPLPGLRGRVLDGIQSPWNSVVSAFPGLSERLRVEGRRKIVWTATVPFAAAAVIALAVLVPWRTTAPPIVTSAPPSTAKVEPRPSIAVPPTPTAPESPRTRPTRRPYSPPPAERRASPNVIGTGIVVAAVAPDDNATEIDPLAPIAPIIAAGTHPADIAPKDIVISPMTHIAQLQIAPLSPPERRN